MIAGGIKRMFEMVHLQPRTLHALKTSQGSVNYLDERMFEKYSSNVIFFTAAWPAWVSFLLITIPNQKKMREEKKKKLPLRTRSITRMTGDQIALYSSQLYQYSINPVTTLLKPISSQTRDKNIVNIKVIYLLQQTNLHAPQINYLNCLIPFYLIL